MENWVVGKCRIVSLLCIAAVLLVTVLAFSVHAQDMLTISSDSAEGLKGQKVDVSIRVQNISSVLGPDITGFAGFEFELVYDAAIADVASNADIKRGDLILDPDDWSTQRNNKATPNSLKYVAASAEELIDTDGTLVVITFTLVDPGSVQLILKDVVLKDQDVQDISPELITISDGIITVTIALEQVEKPSLSDSGIASWDDVDNASSYEVKLWKDANKIQTQVVDQGIGQYDFLSAMRNAGVGDYTVTVKAIGTGLYSDGPVSEASDSQTVVQLGQVGKPVFTEDRRASWTDIADASYYEAQLYKEGVVVATKYAGSGETGFAPSAVANGGEGGVCFYSEMRDAGVGDYYVKVKSVGTGLYIDGDLSVASDMQSVIPIVLTVSDEEGVVTFKQTVEITVKDADYMAGGQFILSYDDSIVKPVSVTPGSLLGDIGATFIVNLEHEQGIFIAWAGATQFVETEGIVCTIEFEVMAEGTTDLEISELYLFDEESEVIPSVSEDGHFTAFDVMFGDINNDGVVDVGDAILLLRYVVDLEDFDDRQFKAADVNGDGSVDVGDAILILRYIVDLIDEFPVDQAAAP